VSEYVACVFITKRSRRRINYNEREVMRNILRERVEAKKLNEARKDAKFRKIQNR
jgi:hypothetical protein